MDNLNHSNRAASGQTTVGDHSVGETISLRLKSTRMCAGLQIKQSRFKPQLGLLHVHCVLGQDTTLTVPLFTQAGVEMDTSEFNTGGNPAMD